MNHLKEPSTWGGLGLAALAIGQGAEAAQAAIASGASLCFALVAFLGGAAAVIVREAAPK